MQLRRLLEKWDLTSLKIKEHFLDTELKLTDEDRDAAWDLYVELITRATAQSSLPDEGDEAVALKTIHDLFPLTRSTIKRHGRGSTSFTRIAVVMLNQKVRPFTVKWQQRIASVARSEADRAEIRAELTGLQADLRNYTRLLADLADVEDLTDVEAV